LSNNGSAEKRQRQSVSRRARNKMLKTKMRSLAKRFLVTVKDKKKSEAEKAFREMVKVIDSAAGKGVLHKRNAARKKSRMHRLLTGLG